MLRRQEKNLEEFEKTYRLCNIVKSAFLSLKCRFIVRLFAQRNRQRKDCSCSSGPSATTCDNSETTQETRVVCLTCAVQPCNVLVQDALHYSPTRKFCHIGNQKQQSADKVISNRPKKLRFGQHCGHIKIYKSYFVILVS